MAAQNCNTLEVLRPCVDGVGGRGSEGRYLNAQLACRLRDRSKYDPLKRPGFSISENEREILFTYSFTVMERLNIWNGLDELAFYENTRILELLERSQAFPLNSDVGCQDIDPNPKDLLGRTPPSYAARKGKEAIVRLLLERDDTDPNAGDCDNRTPLWEAASAGHDVIVQVLLARSDVDPNVFWDIGNTPLWAAACEGHGAVVRLLLARNDVDPNVRNGHLGTPLWQAASRGHDAVVRLLLKRNDVKPNIRSEGPEDPVLSLRRSRGTFYTDGSTEITQLHSK